MPTFEDRADIAAGIEAGLSDSEIADKIGRGRTVVWRERRRNSTKTRGCRPVHADGEAQRRRRRPQAFKIDADPFVSARVRADLARSRTPRQIAGRLRLEASGEAADTMIHSPPAEGATVSHEAVYRWTDALAKGKVAKSAIMPRSRRTQRERRKPLGERTGGRIIGMVSIDDRPEHVADRRVPGAWEGDLIIGRAGKSAAATLVERASRFTLILGLPDGKDSGALADVLIARVNGLPAQVRGSLTWDQGTEMARHAALTPATDLPAHFAHPHAPWERPTNENTNDLIRECLPKGADITDHQPHLDAIADELNDRPRAILGFHTPREVFTKLLNDPVASTA